MSTITLDDTDSRIKYSSGWTTLHGSPRLWLSTAHVSEVNGASATISWKGTSAKIYGTSPIDPGKSEVNWQYTIDGGSPVSQTRSFQSSEAYDVLMVDTGTLGDGAHTLVIQNTGPHSDLRLDRWVLEINDEPQPSDDAPGIPASTQRQPPLTNNAIVTGAHATASATLSAGIQSNTVITVLAGTGTSTRTSDSGAEIPQSSITHPSPSLAVQAPTVSTPSASASEIPDPKSADGSSDHDRLPMGAIVGLILGGIAILLLVAIIAILWRKRRSPVSTNSNHTTQNASSVRGAASITPFDLSHAPNSTRPNPSLPFGFPLSKGEREQGFQRLPDIEEGLREPPSAVSAGLSTQASKQDHILTPFGFPISSTLSAHQSLPRILEPVSETAGSDMEDVPPAYPGLAPSMSKVSEVKSSLS